MCREAGSNRRPFALQANALPTELSRQHLIRIEYFSNPVVVIYRFINVGFQEEIPQDKRNHYYSDFYESPKEEPLSPSFHLLQHPIIFFGKLQGAFEKMPFFRIHKGKL